MPPDTREVRGEHVATTEFSNVKKAAIELRTDPERGLSQTEAALRLAECGPNEINDSQVERRWTVLWRQFGSLMVRMLMLAALASAALGDYQDAIAIAAILILNALLGYHQEYRAERAIAALKTLAAPVVHVRRDGHICQISSRELVPGDIVLMEAGKLVPADCLLLQSVNLSIQEAALTGESEPVEKDAAPESHLNASSSERRNMAHMGTIVTRGRGIGLVIQTGMRTELGSIARMIQTTPRQATPLEQQLNELARTLALLSLGLVGIIFVAGLLRGESLRMMFLTAVSTAVAAVPEGLPAVVTIALALGSQRMLKLRALVRRLAAVETLGSVTVICSDKTGTLTENRMTVAKLEIGGRTIDLMRPEAASEVRADPTFVLLLAGGALCNDVRYEPDNSVDGFHLEGEPTESALAMAAARLGYGKPDLERLFSRVAEVPFDSNRKRMTTIHRLPASVLLQPKPVADIAGRLHSKYIAFAKGAVDSLLDVCATVWDQNGPVPMDSKERVKIAANNAELAKRGMRVLGVAFRTMDELPTSIDRNLERDFAFVGMMGMTDPHRAEVKDAVEQCKSASIRPVMITGDHPLTALHIAEQLGISVAGRTLTGQKLSGYSVAQLETVVEDVPVFARVSPEHKLMIVEALQRRGHVVAMTGDGVNDAPALKRADVGVAMGIAGTDVAKEAADIVLLDDNFATIVAAVEEGRVIYANIRRFVRYLITANSSEILVLLIAPFVGMPLPLLPLQILWMNLVTDGLPALALGVEPAEQDVMRRPPRRPDEKILNKATIAAIAWTSILMTLLSLGAGYWYWHQGSPLWRTVLFTTLTLSQMSLAMAFRSEREPLLRRGLLSNRELAAAILLTVLLQLGAVYVPHGQDLFSTEALPLRDLILCFALSTVPFWTVELAKWVNIFRREQDMDR